MNFYTWKGALISTGIIYVIPIAISAVYRLANIGSVGPVVLFYSLVSLPVFAFVYVMALKTKHPTLPATALGLLGGVVMAVLLINYFMLVTYWFGIYDYQPM